MRLQRIALLSAVAVLAAACQKDKGPFTAPNTPKAYVRYVNAVPDTNALDFKFVDQVEGSPYFGQLSFRDISAYQAVEVVAGGRHIRVFATDPLVTSNAIAPRIDVVSQVYVDTTINFEAGKYYTIVHTGYARTGQTPKQGLTVFEDDRSAAPSGTQIGVKAYNVAVGLGALSVTNTATGGAALPASFASIAYDAATTYALLSTGTVTFQAKDAASTNVGSTSTAPVGAPPASTSQSATAGYSIGGSLLSAFIFRPSVTGSLAKSFATAGVVWINDNYPQQP